MRLKDLHAGAYAWAYALDCPPIYGMLATAKRPQEHKHLMALPFSMEPHIFVPAEGRELAWEKAFPCGQCHFAETKEAAGAAYLAMLQTAIDKYQGLAGLYTKQKEAWQGLDQNKEVSICQKEKASN